MRKSPALLIVGLLLGAGAYIGAQTVGDATFRNLVLTGKATIGTTAVLGVDARTIASNGGGTPATLTLTPTTSYVQLVCQDPDGCTITLGETGVADGTEVFISNYGANVCTFADTVNVSELAGAFSMGTYDSLSLRYVSDRWIEQARGTATTSVVTPASTTTFTNKTYDTEGTGNVFTLAEKLWIPAGVCNNVTATAPLWSLPTTNPAVVSCNTGTNTQKATLDFADGANSLSAQTTLMLPSDFAGTIDVALKWFDTTATTGSVVWQVASICVADAETSDPAFNASSTVTDTAKGTVNQDNDAAIASLTITGCAAGELMYLKVFRDPANASDTMADTAKLRGMSVTYRRGI